MANTKQIQTRIASTAISFTNNTRVITVAGIDINASNVIHIHVYRPSAPITSFSAYMAVANKTACTFSFSTDTTITLDNTLGVLLTGDIITIDYFADDTINNYETGVSSTQVTNPIEAEFDSSIILASAQAPTTAWLALGSAYSGEDRNCFKHTIAFVQGGSLTSLYFKAIGRNTTGDTIVFPIESIKFDKTTRVIEEEDTTDVGQIVYRLASVVSQKFTFTLYTDNNIPEIEIQIKGVGTMTSSTVTCTLNKAWASPSSCVTIANNKAYVPRMVVVASGSSTIPASVWSLVVNSGAADLTLTNSLSETFILKPGEFIEYNKIEGIQRTAIVCNSTSSYKIQYIEI